MLDCTYTKIIIIIILLFLLQIVDRYNSEGMVNIPKLKNTGWTKDNQCKRTNPKAYQYAFDKRNTIRNNTDWTFYLPCGYTHSQREVNRAVGAVNKVSNIKDKRIFIINNADELTSKNKIWQNLVRVYGRNTASKMMPTTYVLSKDLTPDMELFNKEYKKGDLYIMKRNIQRQKGLKITNIKKDVMLGAFHQYVIAQKLLQDPYLINSRKINMRFYLLIVCQNKEVDAYVHKEGFMYYTKDLFKKNCIEDGPNITTGYIDRQVYEVNPLTHGDFRSYLDYVHGPGTSKLVFDRVYKLLSNTVVAVKDKVCNDDNNKFSDSIKFQLFGADIAINDKLLPKVIEVNKGPDIGAKDVRDKGIKNRVIDDIFKIVSGDRAPDFVKVLE